MSSDDRDQDAVAAALHGLPQARVMDDFLARVNARIDETAGWLGLADFRAWTLGLVPAAAVLVLLAILWPGPAASTAAPSPQPVATESSSAATFSPASYSDWQRDVTANALLDAALQPRATDLRHDVR
jgi:hypothetical protein